MPGSAVLGQPHIESPGDRGNPERISGSTRLTETQKRRTIPPPLSCNG
jgi:hypothetical protein